MPAGTPARGGDTPPGRHLVAVLTPDMTVAEMAERYVAKLTAYDAPSYCEAVRYVLERHLVRRYGRMPINDFTISEASQTIGRLRRERHSNSVINLYCGVFRAAFESERRNGRLIDNPWSHVSIPKREPQERRTLSDEEIALLEEAFRHNVLGNYFGLILHTGLKRTEASAIMTQNWDHASHRLLIDGHVDYSAQGRERLERGTYNGLDRWIPLSGEAEGCLAREISRHEERGGQARPSQGQDEGHLVFATGRGLPLPERDIEYHAGVIRKVTGITDFSMGLLRNHFVASRLREGVPVHLLKSYLGLQTRETVLAYASLRSSGTQGAARALEDFFDEVGAGRNEEA